MCGIVGYTGPKDCLEILVEGLRRLEYRGYDSAGVAVRTSSGIGVRRCRGKIKDLESLLAESPLSGATGIGHTRWATHGRPSDENAHPHKSGRIAVVHNGIIENYLELKEELASRGRVFTSETDTEVAAHLVDEGMDRGLSFEDAVRSSLGKLQGSYALVMLQESEPDKLIAARMESPLVLGLGDGEYFLASDVPAILHHTREVIFLEDGDLVVVAAGGFSITDLHGNEVQRETTTISWNPVMAEKAGYSHFMQKEIFEQPRAVIDTFRGRIDAESGDIYLDGLDLVDAAGFKKIFMVACGTSFHASYVGKFLVESLARIPVEVDLASEFRYRDPLVDDETLLVLISQSGETADTLAALNEGAGKGCRIVAITNVVGSSITRRSHETLYTHAGPEIGVASTKAFTTQLTVLFLLALKLGAVRGVLDPTRVRALLKELLKVPHKMEEVLDNEEVIKAAAKRYMNAHDFLYLGRGINFPIALEGALKLKEISYIHAEGYPAGEMKHGPIALIDENMPVVAIVTSDHTREKMLSNIEEVRSRGGLVVVVTDEPDGPAARMAETVIPVPSSTWELMPIILAVPLQLLAYHVAVLRGTDVDQPRNLAKSVTVE